MAPAHQQLEIPITVLQIVVAIKQNIQHHQGMVYPRALMARAVTLHPLTVLRIQRPRMWYRFSLLPLDLTDLEYLLSQVKTLYQPEEGHTRTSHLRSPGKLHRRYPATGNRPVLDLLDSPALVDQRKMLHIPDNLPLGLTDILDPLVILSRLKTLLIPANLQTRAPLDQLVQETITTPHLVLHIQVLIQDLQPLAALPPPGILLTLASLGSLNL